MKPKTDPTNVKCPPGMLWLTVDASKSKKRFVVHRADDVPVTLEPETAPAILNPSDISSYWAIASGTTVVVRRQIVALRHPVSWKDEEIVDAYWAVINNGVLPCATGPRGERLVDIETHDAPLTLNVAESVDVVISRIAAATTQKTTKPRTIAELKENDFFAAFDRLVKSSLTRALEDEAKKP